MAVDKKSQHVGNHGGAYIDNDGMSKQFTYIDHDIKTKIATGSPPDKEDVTESLRKYRQDLIQSILDIPAVFAAEPHQEYVARGAAIEWDIAMIKDEGMSLNRLGEIYTLASNKQSLHNKGLL